MGGSLQAALVREGFLKVGCASGQMGSGFVDLSASCLAGVPFSRKNTGHQET